MSPAKLHKNIKEVTCGKMIEHEVLGHANKLWDEIDSNNKSQRHNAVLPGPSLSHTPAKFCFNSTDDQKVWIPLKIRQTLGKPFLHFSFNIFYMILQWTHPECGTDGLQMPVRGNTHTAIKPHLLSGLCTRVSSPSCIKNRNSSRRHTLTGLWT